MERSEPALVPEWLRCTGSVTGGGTSAHHFASSSLHSDVPLSALSTRNRSFRSTSDKDCSRSAFLDRISSSNSRRSSSCNGSTKHPYSSFARSHRDKNRDKEKERSVIRDPWDHDSSDPLGNILTSRIEKNTSRRSQSMVSQKPGDVLLGRAVELKNSANVAQNGCNGVLSGGNTVSGMQKAAFEKDFPSLGTEEKQGVPDIGRVSSPGVSTAVQSLPIGNSGFIGGEGWTSALAEVPTLIGSSGIGSTYVQQSASATSGSMVGLNMAEALSQAPLRARTTPQLPDKTQRLEELAVKQSRQLIPMTPLMPKPLPKTAVRTSEMIVAAKSAQQQPYSSQPVNQSLRGGQFRSDALKTSNGGKFLVLKPVWENGVSSTAKDVSSPPSNACSRLANSQLAVASSAPTAPSTSPKYPKLSTIERKATAPALNLRSTAEKRSSSQAQSRSDFFNLMRMKTSGKSSAILPDSGPAVMSPTVENSGEVIKEVVIAPVNPSVTTNGSKITSNGDTHEEAHRFSNVGENNLCLNGAIDIDEEEAAFLRSLGWEENAGEDEGLTEEEINAFYQYMKLRPSLKVCRGAQPEFSMLSESCESNLGRASSELSSSDSESKA